MKEVKLTMGVSTNQMSYKALMVPHSLASGCMVSSHVNSFASLSTVSIL